MTIDISQEETLRRYLAEQQIFSPDQPLYVRYFSGGVSATVAFVSDKTRSVIVKQALSHLKVAANWECDPSRLMVEDKALRLYAKLVPSATPTPICYDSQQHIMIREAAPEDCPMWKTQLLDGILDFQVARRAITALSDIHNGTANDPQAAADFADASFFVNLRIDPYIGRVVEKYPDLEPFAKPVVDTLTTRHLALTHGDYSPKNILVNGREICILDLEVAYYGHPCFDLAFFANHFLLKTVKNRCYKDAYLSMLAYMLDLYFEKLTFLPKEEMERDTVQTLAFLFLARVDGKSPAEYLTREEDKQVVRETTLEAIRQRIGTFEELIGLLKSHL